MTETNTPWLHLPRTLTREQEKILLATLDAPLWLTSQTGTARNPGRADTARFNILSAEPLESSRITLAEQAKSCAAAMIERFHQDIPSAWQQLPFVCGLAGYLSYELGTALMFDKRDEATAAGFIAYYSWVYLYDCERETGGLYFSPRCDEALRRRILALIDTTAQQSECAVPDFTLPPWRLSQSRDVYAQQFKRTLDYINAGDVYQINLTQRFESEYSGSSVELFCQLAEKINHPYSAYLKVDDQYEILCFSPEHFISIERDRVTTSPIKGTSNVELGSAGAEQLVQSEKNRAENVMIVDLMRNDLSKSCLPHTVKVDRLFALERFHNVHHLVSTISGQIKPCVSAMDVLLACFPGGSITGAPKKRAMEIIDELEVHRRDAYCGSMFYLSDHGRLDSNIMIRTVVRKGSALFCWAGGGIVADSDCDDEYEESLTKVNNIVRLHDGNDTSI